MKIELLQVGCTKDIFLAKSHYCSNEARSIRNIFYVDKPHNYQELNKWYCELTAYMNFIEETEADIIGCEHYRTGFFMENTMNMLGSDEILNYMNKYDILLGKWDYEGRKHGKSLSMNFDKWTEGDAKTFFSCMQEYDKGFSEYLKSYIKPSGGWHAACNCFISKKEIYIRYWNWLLGFLKFYDEMSPLSENNLRRDGWVAEVVQGAWFVYYGYNIKFGRIVKFFKGLNGMIQQTSPE